MRFPVTASQLAASRNGSADAFDALLGALARPVPKIVSETGGWLLTPAIPLPSADKLASDDDQLRKLTHLLDRFPELTQDYGDAANYRPSLLELAAMHGQTSIASLLIERGMDPKHGTVLHCASTPEMVRLLVKAGADPNKRDSKMRDLRTPLFVAIERPDFGVAKALVECGARFDALDSGGSTPLMELCRRGSPLEVKEFLRLGAPPDTISSDTGLTALDYASFRPVRPPVFKFASMAEIVEAMIKGGASPNGLNRRGDTPILAWTRDFVKKGGRIGRGANMAGDYDDWRAIAAGIRMAVSLGADPSAKDREGRTSRVLLEQAGLTEEAKLFPPN